MKNRADFLVSQYKNQIRKRFGLKTKKKRILKKYLVRFLAEAIADSLRSGLEDLFINTASEEKLDQLADNCAIIESITP